MAKRHFPSRAAERKGPTYTAVRTFQVAEDIVPIAEFKAHLSETIRGLDQRPRPLVLTLNGKPAAVVMSPREYDRLSYRQRFIAAVEEGLADVEARRLYTSEEVEADLEQAIDRASKSRKR
jgi:prevent-host-death family protein